MSFYSPIDRLAQTLPRPKGTGAEFMTELSKMPGYKTQEAEDRGLQALANLPKMERAQFMEALKRKRPVVPEVDVLGEKASPLQLQARAERAALTDFGIPYEELNDLDRRELHKYAEKKGSYHEQWTLPGGSNYREILLKHPRGKFEGVPQHFGGEPNILASVRAKDRTGPNGEKILHLEELQSDWHQQGREKGYQSDAKKEYMRQRELENKFDSKNITPEEVVELEKLVARRQKTPLSNRTPDAPFKKNWHEMALKKMIHHAAKNGYDSIAITPGAEQADRYGLAKHIDQLVAYPDGTLVARKEGANVVQKPFKNEEELAQLIGKETAAKLLSTKPDMNNQRVLGGQDLNLGGEGMKGFYDKIVPNFLNQFGKKYGAKVGRIQVPTDTTMDRGPEGNLMVPRHTQNYAEVHHFPITPEMREDVVKNGVPLYADGGPVQPLRPLNPQLAAMREQIAQQSALHKAYDEAMKNVYTSQMPTFAQWVASQGKAKGGKVENKAEFLKDSKVKDVLYRGGIGYPDMPEDFLKGKARPGYAAFASTSPHVAGSYAHPDQDEGVVGAIAPMHIKVHTVHEFPVTTDKHGSRRFSKTAFDQRAQQLQPGHALVARQVFDYGPRANTKTDPDKLYSYPSDIYAWNDGTEVKSALSKAAGGSIKPVGYTKERITVSPNLDAMRYEMESVKHYTKKAK